MKSSHLHRPNTHDRRRRHGLLLAVLFGHHLGQLLLGPVLDRVVGLLAAVAHVHMNGPLFGLPLDRQIVGELTLVTLGTGALLEERTQNRLRIDALFHLLRRNRLKQGGQLALLLQLLFLLFLLGIRIGRQVVVSTTLDLLLHLGYKLLLLGSLLVLQAKGFVLKNTRKSSKLPQKIFPPTNPLTSMTFSFFLVSVFLEGPAAGFFGGMVRLLPQTVHRRMRRADVYRNFASVTS